MTATGVAGPKMLATLRDLIERSLAVNGDRVALEFRGRQWTYADLERQSGEVASGLYELGVRAGDRVALHTTNCPEFVVCDLALARAGAVKVPLNPLLAPTTAVELAERVGAKVAVVNGPLVERAELLAELPGLTVLQVRDDEHPLAPGARWLDELAGGAAGYSWKEGAVAEGDAAAIFFTGGTTGHPKGAVHSQRSLVALQYAQLLEAEIHDDERVLLTTPLAHAAGLFAQSTIVRGATVLLHDGFDVDAVVRALAVEDATWLFLVPTMIYRLLDALRDRAVDLSRLRTIVYGASPISPPRLSEALEVFGPVFVQLYGQTECPNWGTRLVKRDHDVDRPQLLGSCGKASLLAEVTVVDEEGHDLPPGEVGEVCLASPYLLDCYLGDEEATREKFLGHWIRTGDIGVLDEHGYLYLKDRRADMVITGGMNVYCREVEDVLAQHPAVANVAVIGIPHDDWGESVHAVVVARAGSDLDADELLQHARARLARYAVPKSVDVVAALPETPYGKIDKKELRAPWWAGRDREVN